MSDRAIRGIVIDPGHGGDDPGASGNGIVEKDLNLQISNYMYEKFKNLGIPVKMTRTTDETVSPNDRTARILDAFGNNKDVIVISNHINSGGGDGAEVIYALRNNSTLANSILNALGNAGQNMRKAYQRRLPSDTSKDYYFIHRNTGVTQPVIVEYGFLDSTGDDVSQLKNNWQKYADAVVDAVENYIGVSTGSQEGYYTVKSGDSLWSIAKKYDTTVDELKRINNLTSNTLSIGQILKLPSTNQIDNQDYIIYTVKSGDNLYAIGREYGLTMDELMKYNNLNSTLLSIGQQLKIPKKQESTNQNTGNHIEYTVKKGDNLYAIGRQYSLSQDEIMKYNNLTSNLLSIGQILKIPITNNNLTYTVQSGDSLYSIARKFNTTVDSIKQKNNLTTNMLSIGQKIII